MAKPKATFTKMYEVYLRDRESVFVYAEDYEQIDDEGLFFWGKNGECVAWFHSEDIIGWVETHELTIGGEEQEYE